VKPEPTVKWHGVPARMVKSFDDIEANNPDIKFFAAHIVEYNKRRDFDTHLVRMPVEMHEEPRAMLIWWGKHRWEYAIYLLEES